MSAPVADASTPMRYEELPAPDDLAPWVVSFWIFEVADGAGEIEHRIPLTGGATIALQPGREPMLTGQRVAPLVVPVRGGELHYGAHLRPGAVPSLLKVDAKALRDRIGPARLWLDPAWCASFVATESPIERLVDAMRQQARCAGPLDPVVMRAVDRALGTSGAVLLSSLVGESGLSVSQFRRRFVASVGLLPKELLRIRRVRASAAAAVLERRSWAEVAAGGGFSDQAHLVREFHTLLGASPGAFREHASRIAHRLVE